MEAYERLEMEWAEFNELDPRGMVACSSGTAALHLALEAFRLPQGSEVLVPDYTMIACPRAVTMAGLKPVFGDCNERLVMSGIHKVNFKKETPKVVMPVSVFGRKACMRDTSQKPDWMYIVEDLAEAHGVRPKDYTDAACWSFYKNKIVAGEEGGAVWFRDPDHAKLARQLRTLGFTEAHDYTHIPRGHNYRMSNAHAKLVLNGFTNGLDDDGEWVGPSNSRQIMNRQYDLRREIESWYDHFCPAEWRQPARDAVWVYDVRIPGLTRDRMGEVVRSLREAGVQARYGFYPCRRQAEYAKDVKMDGFDGFGGEWESDKASNEVFYLPVIPGETTKFSIMSSFEIIKSMVGY